MAKTDPLKQAEDIKAIAESFIQSRLSVNDAYHLAVQVVLGTAPSEQGGVVGFRAPEIVPEDEDE